MRRILLDVNVVLDVLLDREPHVTEAAAIWAAIEREHLTGILSAHAVTTIYYLAQRAHGRPFAQRALVDLLTVFHVAPVDEFIVRRALTLGWQDFEDAVSAVAAEAAGCIGLVTRDTDGFPNAPLPIFDPASIIAFLHL